MIRLAVSGLVAFGLLAPLAIAAPATAAPAAAPSATDTATLCDALEAAAQARGLPLGFFTRLIWRESRFDPTARSPAGAEGVAQFMPATAGERGLIDPFQTTQALRESAGYLRDLYAQFGNWGLAAAAYNAGPGRVGRWRLGDTTTLPSETIRYVLAVTGHDVEEWRAANPPALAPEPTFSCATFAGEAGRRVTPMDAATMGAATSDAARTSMKPWSVILVGALNRAAVLREYAIVRASHSAVLGALTPTIVQRRVGGPIKRYVAQIERDDRASSTELCRRLQASGGVCVVLRNMR